MSRYDQAMTKKVTRYQRFFGVLMSVMLAGLVGCAARETGSSGGTDAASASSSSSASSSTSASTEESGIELDMALVQELQAHMRITYEQGLDAPGSMAEFCKENPDFLWVRVQRLRTSSRVDEVMGETGMQVWLLLPPGVQPEEDLFNRERLAQFVENQKNGVPDSIVIVSSGSPIPLWLTVLSCKADGSYTILSGYPRQDGLEWLPSYEGLEILETETEWVLQNDEQAWHSYPKYGYEPIPLGEIGARTETEVQALIPPLCEDWDAQTDRIVARDASQLLDGVDCYVFERHRNGEYTGDCFAVAKDLSRYYFVEHVDGNWVLYARPKAAG